MYILTIFAVGIVSTAFMFGLQQAVLRLGIMRGSWVEAVGSFAIPERLQAPLIDIALHLAAGVVFTCVYAYIFHFLHLTELSEYLAIGGLVGLVHGFFVSYFAMMGFATPNIGVDDEADEQWTFLGASMNVLLHIAFGLMIGLGFGFYATRGTVLWFVMYTALIGLSGAALLLLVKPPVPGPNALPKT